MRLINVRNFRLEEFHDCTQVKYAILSHRWEEREEDEVLYKDMVQANGETVHLRTMRGFYKIDKSCKEAAKRGYQYVWADTCCIDKSSSAELQEAINSMFRWYACAEVCFAFLFDVQWAANTSTFDKSQWFERGWTLQELLAPPHLVFFDACWNRIDNRQTMAYRISTITGIPEEFLTNNFDPKMNLESRPCIAAIMSWASSRKTTRPEDRAYSLLGLFDVNMPILYGEGEKAFYRLQVELLQQSEDQSIFAWDRCEQITRGLLANSPDDFRPTEMTTMLTKSHQFDRRLSSQVSSEGILLEVRLVPVYSNIYMALFNLNFDDGQAIGIYVYRIHDSRFARITTPFPRSTSDLAHWRRNCDVSQLRRITIVRRLDGDEVARVKLVHHKVHGDQRITHDDIKLSVTSEGKDPWTNWLNMKEVEPLIVKGDRALSKFHGGTFDREKLTIQLKGSVSFALACSPSLRSFSFPFGSLALGFDFDSNFMCLISMSIDKHYCRHIFQHLLHVPDEEFDFREPADSSRIKVSSCRGGRYHIMQNATAFKLQKQWGFDPEAMVIRVQINADTIVQLAVVNKLRLGEGWCVYLDLKDEPDFTDEIIHMAENPMEYKAFAR